MDPGPEGEGGPDSDGRRPWLRLIFTLTGTLGSPLFWAIALFEASWAACLLRRKGLHRVGGWAFLLGSLSSLVYFVMRYTGPYRAAEVFHELLILFMIIGVGCLGALLLMNAAKSRELPEGVERGPA